MTAEAEIAAATARDERARSAVAIYRGGARDLARQNLDVVRQTYELGRGTVFDVSKCPPQGGARFVRFSKRIAVPVFEIQIAALLGQDVEDGGASELVRLASPRPDSAGPDREPHLCRPRSRCAPVHREPWRRQSRPPRSTVPR